MYARKPSRSHASHQSVHKQYQVVQTPPKLVINTYNAPKQIPPIQLSEEHSLRLSDSRAGIRYNLMGKRGEPLTYEHPNQVIVTVLDSDGGGVRTGVYNHEDVSVSRIIDDIPKELTFQINSRQTRKDGITIDDADAVKTELINKLSIIPELTKEFLVASKDLSVIEPVPEVTSQTTAEDKAEVNSKVAQSSEPLNAASQPLNVANMSATEKLGEAMKRAAMKLPKSVGEQLLAMVNPTSLAIMVGVLGAYAASHAVGIGVIADAVMAVGAGATIGWQAVSAAKDLWGFAQFINATTEEDLDKAASDLANFVSTVGIDVVLGILFKKAAGKAKNYGDDLNRVDEVSAHSDDVTLGRVNDVDNANKTPSTNIETTSTTVNEIEYPEGISYRQDLPKHLQTFDVFTQKNGVGGAHNLDAFNQAVAEKGIRIISKTEHPTIKGIYQIEYEVPLLDKQLRPTGDYKLIKKPKTVYDPTIHSDEKILQLGQQAAAKGLDNAIANNKKQFTQEAGGITFRVYIDKKTKTITNVHPDFNNGL